MAEVATVAAGAVLEFTFGELNALVWPPVFSFAGVVAVAVALATGANAPLFAPTREVPTPMPLIANAVGGVAAAGFGCKVDGIVEAGGIIGAWAACLGESRTWYP